MNDTGSRLSSRPKRSERMAAIALRLALAPNSMFTLTQLASEYDCAKSTLSEDMTILHGVLQAQGLGLVETVPGASGGVRYRPYASAQQNLAFVSSCCETLQQSERVMSSGFIYTTDLFSNPRYVARLGTILAQEMQAAQPDVVVTIESKGVPIGLMTAQALGVPLVIASKEIRATEGSVVTLNYRTASRGQLQSMSLPRRALTGGKRALLVDDFVKGGGTLRALCEMMGEFSCEIAGMAALIASPQALPCKDIRLRSLMVLNSVDLEARSIDLRPTEWLVKNAEKEAQRSG